MSAGAWCLILLATIAVVAIVASQAGADGRR